jgi:hypothetical protein
VNGPGIAGLRQSGMLLRIEDDVSLVGRANRRNAMKIETTLAVIALTLAPSIVLAFGGCNYGRTEVQSVSQCAVGQIWDEATQTCIAPVSS